MPSTFPARRGQPERGGRLALALLAFAASLGVPAAHGASRLANLSTRARLGPGAEDLLVGFVVAGRHGQPLLLRTVGPSLSRFNVADPLPDPELRLLDASGRLIGLQEDWSAEPALVAVTRATGAFALDPSSRDAALLEQVAPGRYVVQATARGQAGVVLVEAYAADLSADAHLINLSARGRAGPGDAALIAGFSIAGETPLPVLLRAIGPTLADFGVSAPLADPALTLWGRPGEVLASNDNWSGDPGLARTFTAAGAFALDPASRDSALALTLPPGTYSVQVDGRGDAVGEALVEIYATPASAPPPSPEGTIPLFNGRDLSGLYVWSRDHGYGDPTGIYTVTAEGLLRVAGEENYAGLTTGAEYGDYVMTFEFKWGERTFGKRRTRARDAGLLLHSVGPEGAWRGRLRPAIEVQVLEGGMGDFILLKDTLSPPGTNPMRIECRVRQVRCRYDTWNCRGGYVWDPEGEWQTFEEASASVHALHWDPKWRDVLGFRGTVDLERPTGEWNQFVILAQGDRIEVYFNGVKVNEARHVFPTRGRIQLESELAEYYVRRWDLRPLE